MPRVGFAGLKGYTGAAKARLDQEADKRADRIDAISARGMDTLGKYDKHFDGIDQQIDDMDAMVREGANGAPLSGS